MPHTLPLMVFAAGFGTRMGLLTKERPKPLIPIAGKALIDHALDVAQEAKTKQIVVNVHYLADQLVAHLAKAPVIISDESDEILDTGGGLKAALPLLGDGPVMTLNSDAIWTGENPLTQLANAWNEEKMDVLFLLLPASEAKSATGRSDFVMDETGRIDWARGREGYHYLGAQILNPAILSDEEGKVFSLRGPWTRAMEQGRAYGLIHQGGWCDVGHPEGIAIAENLLKEAHADVRR